MQKSELLISLGVMFAGFQAGRPLDPSIADELVRPLLSFEDAVINEAIWNFRNGAVAGMDKHYPPSIPEIVAEVRRIAAHRARLAAYDTPQLAPPTVSDAERKRIGVKMVKLAKKLGKEAEAREDERRARRRQIALASNEWHRARDPRPREEQLAGLVEALDRRRAGA